MNAPDKLDPQKFADLLTLTREPFPASRKTWLQGSRADLRVPMREVALTSGECVTLYDTSGPYTDPAAGIDVKCGLPNVRGAWFDEPGDTEAYGGRAAQALDDGAKHEDSERIAALRAD